MGVKARARAGFYRHGDACMRVCGVLSFLTYMYMGGHARVFHKPLLCVTCGYASNCNKPCSICGTCMLRVFVQSCWPAVSVSAVSAEHHGEV